MPVDVSIGRTVSLAVKAAAMHGVDVGSSPRWGLFFSRPRADSGARGEQNNPAAGLRACHFSMAGALEMRFPSRENGFLGGRNCFGLAGPRRSFSCALCGVRRSETVL